MLSPLTNCKKKKKQQSLTEFSCLCEFLFSSAQSKKREQTSGSDVVAVGKGGIFFYGETVTFWCTARTRHQCASYSLGPPEFKPIMDNNHITARYIKDLAYRSVGSHSGTFHKATHSRALTGSMLCIKCVTQESVFWAIWFPASPLLCSCAGFIKKTTRIKNK